MKCHMSTRRFKNLRRCFKTTSRALVAGGCGGGGVLLRRSAAQRQLGLGDLATRRLFGPCFSCEKVPQLWGVSAEGGLIQGFPRGKRV